MMQNERLKAKRRLIELFETSPSIVGSATWREYYEQTADHFLDNGVIVPPCKVGDTVYKIDYTPCTKYGDYPYSSLCDGCMTPCDSHPTIATYVVPTNTWIVREFIDNVKQHYYLTREAAEQALKERET